jgi:hypothetical protein
MASPTSPFTDHAAPILAEDPALSNDQRADLHDAFYSKNPDELIQHLQPLTISDDTKQALHVAKQKSMPPVNPLDKTTDIMTRMSKIDPSVLALAEAHPNVLKAMTSAARTEEKGSGTPAGASKTAPKGKTPKKGNNAAMPTPDMPATPSGHALVQGSDGSLHHIPHANLNKAREIDPQLQILHVEP